MPIVKLFGHNILYNFTLYTVFSKFTGSALADFCIDTDVFMNLKYYSVNKNSGPLSFH